MEAELILQAVSDLGAIAALALWILAERRDNNALWGIIESLVKLRLRQFEENAESSYMELD